MSSAEKRQACTHLNSVKTRQHAVDQDIRFPRTHRFLGVWTQISNDPDILQTVEGYSVKFQQTPFQMTLPLPLRNLSEERIAAIDKGDCRSVKKKGL